MARVRAPSTARTKSGTVSADSRTQVVNGLCVRSIAPTAPRSEATQNPSAKARTTASGSTVSQGTSATG